MKKIEDTSGSSGWTEADIKNLSISCREDFAYFTTKTNQL